MNSAALGGRLLWSAERPINAWYDVGSDRTVWLLLALFVACWTAFHLIANASIDLHSDSVEMYAWSRHLSAGYYKHPPLGAFVAAVWFAVFPAADWSLYLLSIVNAAVGLLAADLIAKRYLTGGKRLLALLLLLLIPFYQFHSERFGANQLLLSTWPLATYCFLRAFETQSFRWSATAGAMAALAMLGKYYSVYLVAGFIVAALAHPARWTYLRSPSPWISAAVGLLVLAPHIHWLVRSEFLPITYAVQVHGSSSVLGLIGNVGKYLVSALAYVAVLIAVSLLAVRPSRPAFAEALWPSQPNRRMLVVLLAALILLPPATAPLAGMEITGLWTMSAWFLLPVVLLAPDEVKLRRLAANHVALGVAAITIAAFLASPAVAWVRHMQGTKHGQAYYRPVAERLTQEWRGYTGRPLSIVRGHAGLIEAVVFYSPDHPDAVPALSAAPWVTPERLEHEGWAFVCFGRDAACRTNAQNLGGPEARRIEMEITPRFLGHAGKTEVFLATLVPSAKAAP